MLRPFRRSDAHCRKAQPVGADDERVRSRPGNRPHVILSEAKDLRCQANRAPGPEILRFAQDDMWRRSLEGNDDRFCL